MRRWRSPAVELPRKQIDLTRGWLLCLIKVDGFVSSVFWLSPPEGSGGKAGELLFDLSRLVWIPIDFNADCTPFHGPGAALEDKALVLDQFIPFHLVKVLVVRVALAVLGLFVQKPLEHGFASHGGVLLQGIHRSVKGYDISEIVVEWISFVEDSCCGECSLTPGWPDRVLDGMLLVKLCQGWWRQLNEAKKKQQGMASHGDWLLLRVNSL